MPAEGQAAAERHGSRAVGQVLASVTTSGSRPWRYPHQGEPLGDTVRRECSEEVGVLPLVLAHVGSFFTHSRRSGARMHVFFGSDCSLVRTNPEPSSYRQGLSPCPSSKLPWAPGWW